MYIFLDAAVLNKQKILKSFNRLIKFNRFKLLPNTTTKLNSCHCTSLEITKKYVFTRAP